MHGGRDSTTARVTNQMSKEACMRAVREGQIENKEKQEGSNHSKRGRKEKNTYKSKEREKREKRNRDQRKYEEGIEINMLLETSQQ